MPDGYWDFFDNPDIPTFVEGLSALAAREPDLIATAQYVAVLKDIQRDLAALAARTAAKADETARGVLKAKRKRPAYASPDHGPLEEHIKSEPFPGLARLGAVGIARESLLHEHPGWAVQEYGSKEIYPGFVGRLLYGAFVGGEGSPDSPRRRYGIEGGEDPPHAKYIPGGSPSGPGVIRQDIEPKHFLRAADDVAWAEYLRGVRVIEATYAARLLRIAGQAQRRALGRL